MQEIWRRIEHWLAIHAPALLADLQPGASEQAIAETEGFLGITFPEDIRASFRLHDGQAGDGPWMMDGWELLSLTRICDEWRVWKDLYDSGDFDDALSISTDPIRSDWWNPSWIPLTYS
jgi:cell wall assembly regulator SMI1